MERGRPKRAEKRVSGVWIREAMNAAGLTRADIARAVGCTHQAVTYWMHGRNRPSAAMASRVRRACKVKREEIER